LHREEIEYRQGEALLQGYLVYDDAGGGKRPGVLVVHEWWGLNDYARSRADQLAGLGYIAFALDMYGKGVAAETPAEAAKLAGIYRSDRPLMRARARAGLDVLLGQELADRSRIAAVGYCFGGGTVLELARSGVDIAGVVSFHGDVNSPDPADEKNIKAKVLVLHGAGDTHVDEGRIVAFWNAMKRTDVDWQLNVYCGAVHGFTNPASGNDPSRGVAYNKDADRRSWEAMRLFFAEIFAKEGGQKE
jgi:dienelactone hydrolase